MPESEPTPSDGNLAGRQEKSGGVESGSNGQDVDKALQSDAERAEAAVDDGDGGQKKNKKSLAFHLSFIGISLIAFLFSLDATTQAVALPVSLQVLFRVLGSRPSPPPPPFHSPHETSWACRRRSIRHPPSQADADAVILPPTLFPRSQVIAEQLHGTTLQSFWAGIAYLLGVVVTQPLYTAVSDVFGRKPTLYFGLLLFALGSLVFAVARNMITVVVGRVLQGVGGGGMDLMAEVIVADMTTLQERSLYLGLLAIPTAIGSILGPTLGALFTANVSWRWIGWINLPILGAAVVLVVFFLRLRPVESDVATKLRRVDWGGAALSLVGVTVFVVPLSWANALYPWRSWETLVPLLLGAGLLCAFMLYEFRVPSVPIFPLRLFGSRTANLTLVGNFVHGASLYALLQYLPLFYQAVTLNTAIGAAVRLLPTSVVSVVFAVVGVIMVGVVGKGYRWPIRAYWAVLALGTGLLGLLRADSPAGMLLGLPVLWGAAVGALMRLLHLPMQASVSNVDDTGLVIGLLLLVRLLGGVVGLAMSSSIFTSVFESSTGHLDLRGPLAPLRDASQAVGFIPQLRTLDVPPDVLNPVLEAYATSMGAIFYTMTGLAAVGLLTGIFTQDVDLGRTELGRQRFEH